MFIIKQETINNNWKYIEKYINTYTKYNKTKKERFEHMETVTKWKAKKFASVEQANNEANSWGLKAYKIIEL